MKRGLIIRVFYSALMLVSCEARPPIPPCPRPSDLNIFLVDELDAACGVPSGTIITDATGGKGGYEFQINGGEFQSGGTFEGVRPGIHVVTARDAELCKSSIAVHVASGISYKATIHQIIITKCATTGCHDGTSISFFHFDNLVRNPSDIKGLTQSRNMPKAGSPPLTNDEIEKIACWVDDGALNN